MSHNEYLNNHTYYQEQDEEFERYFEVLMNDEFSDDRFSSIYEAIDYIKKEISERNYNEDEVKDAEIEIHFQKSDVHGEIYSWEKVQEETFIW